MKEPCALDECRHDGSQSVGQYGAEAAQRIAE
jgi:hypothetical protein